MTAPNPVRAKDRQHQSRFTRPILFVFPTSGTCSCGVAPRDNVLRASAEPRAVWINSLFVASRRVVRLLVFGGRQSTFRVCPEPEPWEPGRAKRAQTPAGDRLAPESLHRKRYLIRCQRSGRSRHRSLGICRKRNSERHLRPGYSSSHSRHLSTQHSMPIMDIGTQAATTLIRPVFRERGFRRITICTS